MGQLPLSGESRQPSPPPFVPRMRQKLREEKLQAHRKEQRAQESRVRGALLFGRDTDHPIARAILPRLASARDVDELAWMLDEELHRWFGHRHDRLRFDEEGDCCCGSLAAFLYPELLMLLERLGDEA